MSCKKDRPRYCLISPCRNEAEYMRRTLDSVMAQTLPPALWVIVDDGSTDETPRILDEYAQRSDIIKVVRRTDRGVRSVGPGVIEAFEEGLATVDLEGFRYLCKLDLDLELPHRYFEILINRMEAEPRIGTCSGKPYFPAPVNTEKSFEGKLISEAIGDEMSVGMTKLLRVSCFLQIGGFVRQVTWDGIDCHRCRMLGWIACSWDEPELRFLHLRPMGSSYRNVLTGRRRYGFGQYFMGTSFLYMAASAMFRMTRPPLIIGGLTMLWGYVKAMMSGVSRYDDLEFRRFLRRYQWSSLLRGKRKATQRLNAIQASKWDSGLPRQGREAVPPETD